MEKNNIYILKSWRQFLCFYSKTLEQGIKQTLQLRILKDLFDKMLPKDEIVIFFPYTLYVLCTSTKLQKKIPSFQELTVLVNIYRMFCNLSPCRISKRNLKVLKGKSAMITFLNFEV